MPRPLLSDLINVPMVTSLPAGPSDGMEILFLADATNGIVWHLRYRAASASAYKWELVGGSCLMHAIDTSEGTTSASYVDLATVGPQITLPLAGDYDLEYGAFVAGSAANYVFMTPKIGAAAAADIDCVQVWADSGNEAAHRLRKKRFTVAAASTLVKLQYRSGSGTTNWSQRVLYAMPVRVG
jgi:hypothetical protein